MTGLILLIGSFIVFTVTITPIKKVWGNEICIIVSLLGTSLFLLVLSAIDIIGKKLDDLIEILKPTKNQR